MHDNLRAVVFDMDGVLIDSHPAHRAAWAEFLRLSGHSVSEEELSFILDGRTRTEILRHFFGELGDEELSKYGRSKDEIFRAMEHEISAVPGVLDFIEELRRAGMRLAVATSASEIRTFSTLERLGLGGCFHAVVTAGDVLAGKPDPAVFSLACEEMDAVPGQAMAFDDATAGIEAARSAGMRCIGVANNGGGAKLVGAGAERVIADFVGFDLKNVI